ncbi:acetyl-CoA-benzylalcohol acetyltransferase-like [Rhodamnia argentea]|uniref:Acetyl-CoA-benzylalcohol acetyltransferase-like n=1 Tax=Rhodamnia argentea TaxID=178133 RepID=A0A8B8N5Q8_9MYRT|nr:acetyl-CoA-benzylalcohol acetyltransferase-like [Rhodamnia argentea]
MKVEVQWKKVVKPSVPTPHHRQILKLSSIDELQVPNYVGIISYYRDKAENSGVDIPERLHRMEESLSETLTIFYPMAGRYIEDGGCFIDCNDHGVEFVDAKVDAQIDEIVHGEPDLDLLDRLSKFPTEVVGVNVLECGGLVIGLRISHKIGDMYTMAMFMNSWATACQGNMHEIVRPSFELSSIFTLKESSRGTWPEPCIRDEKFFMHRFRFDGKAISKLKSLATADMTDSPANRLQPSRVEVVSALIARALVNIDRSKHGKLRSFVVCMTMNLREKIGLTVPANSCGNLYTVIAVQLRRAIADDSNLVFKEAVSTISEMVRNSRARYARLVEGEELSTMVKDSTMDFMKLVFTSEENLIPFSSWCRFGLHKNDFGWGRPALVGPAAANFRSIFLIDDEDKGGIDAWVTLKEDEMILFKQDPEIQAFTSQSEIDVA